MGTTMLRTPHVVVGFLNSWRDHNKGRPQQLVFTFDNRAAGIWTNLTAVVLTLAAPWVFLLFQRLIEVLWRMGEAWYQTHTTALVQKDNDPDEHARERLPLLEAGAVYTAAECATSSLGNDRQEDCRRHSQKLSTSSQESPDSMADSDTQEPCGTSSVDGDVHSIDIVNSMSVNQSICPLGSSVTTVLDSSEHDVEAGPVQAEPKRPASGSQNLEAFMLKKTPQAASAKLLKMVFQELLFPGSKKAPRDWTKIWGRLFLGIICTALFVLLTYATIMSSQLISEAVVLSDSPTCGIWNMSPFIGNVLSTFSYMQEVEAGDTATRCYIDQPTAECNRFFLEPQIAVQETHNSTCPFVDDFCLEGKHAAYKLSTSLTSSKVLGINVPIGYTFNRTTICAPIQRDEYIAFLEFPDRTFVLYFYGEHAGLPGLPFDNLTWARPVRDDPLDPGYAVDPFCSSPSKHQGWQPIDEFRAGNDTQVALLLVSSQKNFHMDYREDPIFPATDPRLIGSNIMYINNDPVATIMACSDRTNICDVSGTNCWDPEEQPPESVALSSQTEQDGYFMLQVALMRSSTCHSIKYRGGAALVAQSKLNTLFSLPLPIEQWKVEARNLFAVSLARIQIDLRDYARGTAHNEPGFMDYMDPDHRGMCKMYKFHGLGYTNLMVLPFVTLLLGSFVVFVMTFKVNVRIKNEDGQATVKRRFLIEVMIVYSLKGFLYLAGEIQRLTSYS